MNTTGTTDNTKHHLLYLEDETSFADKILPILEQSFDVKHVTNFTDAVESLAQERFHIIVADIVVPFKLGEHAIGRRGFDLIKRQQQNSRLNQTTILMIVSSVTEIRDILIGKKELDKLDKGKNAESVLQKGLKVDGVWYFHKFPEPDEGIDLDPSNIVDRIKEEIEARKAHIPIFGMPSRLDIKIHGADEAIKRLMDIIIDFIAKDRAGEQDAWVKQFIVTADNENIRKRIKHEFIDLIHQLFPENNVEGINLEVLGGGFSDTCVVEAHAERMLPVVIKIGHRNSIEAEIENYTNYVLGRLGNRTSIEYAAKTPLLTGIRYTFAGGAEKAIASIIDFEDAFKKFDVGSLISVLTDLFEQNCSIWYKNSGVESNYEYHKRYVDYLKCDVDKLQKAINRISGVLQDSRLDAPFLKFNHLEHIFYNPLHTLINPATKTWDFSITYSTKVCITHGDFNARNILIDDTKKSWLIDFFRTGEEHMLRDFIQLETVIKFVLLEGGTLQDRYEFERMLVSQSVFYSVSDRKGGDSETKSLIEEYRKMQNNVMFLRAFELIVHLRFLAGKVYKETRQFRAYEYGLLFCSLNTFRFTDIPVTNACHALMAAAMLWEKINPSHPNQ